MHGQGVSLLLRHLRAWLAAPCESRTRTLPIRTAARRSHADRKIDSSPLAGSYNEFIVYDTKQIRQKYILQVKFKFRGGYY